jgi:glucosylceramidase
MYSLLKKITKFYFLFLCLTPIYFLSAEVINQENSKPGKAEIYLTAKGTNDRISLKVSVNFFDLEQPSEQEPTIILDKNKTFQTIIGFGGALTDASSETFFKLSKQKQEEILTALFDKEKGDGFSLCRTSIHSCDFSSESYTYAEAGDTNLSHFSVEHDLKYRIPFIKAAFSKTNNDLKIFASPWSPPAWMKTNKTMLHGGKLLSEYDQTWANYFVKFVKAYKDEGIPIWGLTVQNEPMASQTWESCIFTASEERDFVKNYLGPALWNSGLVRY